MAEELIADEDDCAIDVRQRAPGGGMARLLAVMARLRGPGGCPWDREQTLESLKPCLLEETHELLEAMDNATPGPHLEELGDVLLQVVFQSRVREERGEFGLDEVAHALCDTYSASMAILRGFCASFNGIVTRSKPFLRTALTPSASTLSGSSNLAL